MAKAVRIIPSNGVDDYLLTVSSSMREPLEKLREAIKKAAPKADEIISYRIPTYKQNGPLVHFAAFKDHCSFIVVDKRIIKTFEKELKGYKISGTTIHFTGDKPLPSTLVQKIVKSRIRQNEERNTAKAKK